MLEQISPLWTVLTNHRQEGRPLVLATLVRTRGSSYKKAGAMMLIEANGTTHGLLSGGCLEQDLAEHAQAVFSSAEPMLLHYDMSDDSVFGLGAGCDGQLDILLQLLKGDYLPLSALNPTPGEASLAHLTLATDPESNVPLAAYQVSTQAQTWQSYPEIKPNTTGVTTLTYQPPPRLIICGAGIDVIPILKIFHLLHWHITLTDHRPALLTAEWVPTSTQTCCVPIRALNEKLPEARYDGAIIMSHNLQRDAAYLLHFNRAKTPWIGLLGPPERRDKVLKLAQLDACELSSKLHAPIGLNLGGHTPENIAVTIVAQLQQHFYRQT